MGASDYELSIYATRGKIRSVISHILYNLVWNKMMALDKNNQIYMYVSAFVIYCNNKHLILTVYPCCLLNILVCICRTNWRTRQEQIQTLIV